MSCRSDWTCVSDDNTSRWLMMSVDSWLVLADRPLIFSALSWYRDLLSLIVCHHFIFLSTHLACVYYCDHNPACVHCTLSMWFIVQLTRTVGMIVRDHPPFGAQRVTILQVWVADGVMRDKPSWPLPISLVNWPRDDDRRYSGGSQWVGSTGDITPIAPLIGEAMAPTALGHRLMEPVNAEITFIGLVSVAETVIQLVVSAGCWSAQYYYVIGLVSIAETVIQLLYVRCWSAHCSYVHETYLCFLMMLTSQ